MKTGMDDDRVVGCGSWAQLEMGLCIMGHLLWIELCEWIWTAFYVREILVAIPPRVVLSAPRKQILYSNMNYKKLLYYFKHK